MKNKFEKLILLEFLVNKVELFENEFNIDKYFLSRLGDLCVQIKFKGCFILEIKEDENSRTVDGENGKKIIHLDGGKSCLLSVGQIMSNSDCEATVCISRKTPDGEPKEYFTFGLAKVNLAPVFKVLVGPVKCGPPVKAMRGEFDVIDGQCTKIGTVDIFVRGTGLGKNIVTMFQLGAGESSFYFKGTEQPSEEESEAEEDSLCAVCKSEFGPTAQPKRLRPEVQRPVVQDPFYPYKEGTTYTQQMPQSMPWGAPPSFQPGFQGGFQPGQAFGQGMPPGAMGGMPGMGGPRPPGPAPPGSVPYAQSAMAPAYQNLPTYRDEDYEKLEGDYKEISAEVNGYEVKIKLLRRPKKVST